MSNPQPTSQIADWLSENLPAWLDQPHHPRYSTHSYGGARSIEMLHDLVNQCVLPHISAKGIHSMYEFIQEDYAAEELPFYNPGGTE